MRTGNMAIRPYADGDFRAVTKLWLESWKSTGIAAPLGIAELRALWRAELESGMRVYVATDKEEIVGFIGLKKKKLEQLFIAPGFQCRGIGKELLNFAKKKMPEGFVLQTALATRAPAFYEREGLTAGKKGIHPRFGHDIVVYRWRPSGGRT